MLDLALLDLERNPMGRELAFRNEDRGKASIRIFP